MKIKVMTIVGTRPEVIRLSRVICVLGQFVSHVLVHTGQNYDHELNQIFFDELGIPSPQHFLKVDTSSVGATLGSTLIETEKVIRAEKPDAVLILGDTNSAISAIIAKRLKVPVYHMEAGNRCFDANVPEEINRRIVDRISDFNLVYTEHARRHLISEGFPHRRIYLTGSPMKEVLEYYGAAIERSSILTELKLAKSEYFVVSMHREENVDNRKSLKGLVSMLEALAKKYSWPIIVSTHPRTMKRLEELGAGPTDARVHFLPPFGFFAYIKLQQNAACVLSDSGTVTEEASLLRFPAVTIRTSMERPEGLDTGSIILSGIEAGGILESVEAMLAQHQNGIWAPIPQDYQIDNTSQRVLNLILGTARLSNEWDGILENGGL